jgi:hypothetical protein
MLLDLGMNSTIDTSFQTPQVIIFQNYLVTGETWMHYMLRQQNKKLQKAGKGM